MRVGFIFPSSEYLHDPFKGDPHTHLQILTVLEARFGNQLDLSLIDLRGIKKDFALSHIRECDVYLHSVYTLDYDEQVSIVSALRKRYPATKHIAGGPHAIACQEECLRTFDALVLGDGEEAIVEVINDLMRGALKNVYKQTSVIDINQYPYPRRHFQPQSAVAKPGMMRLKNKSGYEKLLGTTTVFNRGCPFKCAYCAMPQLKRFSPGIRYKEPLLVEEEIEYLKRDFQVQGLSILDEIGIPMTLDKAIPYLEAIARTGIVWRGQCRVDGITDETARLARDSGCVAMGMGVESVSQKCLDIINKNYDATEVRERIRLLKKYGIEARIYLILGLPGEDDSILEQTWSFIKETSPDLVVLSILTVRPGTDMYDHSEKYGMKRITTDWSKTMHMFGRYKHETPTLTFEYNEQTPWGKGLSSEQIISNYMELQARLKVANLRSL